MTSAGKLQLIQDLYNKGLLCNCKKITVDWIDGDHGINTLIHRKNCVGKKQILKLLSLK